MSNFPQFLLKIKFEANKEIALIWQSRSSENFGNFHYWRVV